MTTKTYSTKANARRALSKIGKAALCKAAELITEVDGEFQFNLEAAEEIQNTYECDGDCECEVKTPAAQVLETMLNQEPVADLVEDDPTQAYGYERHGLTHCPKCGIHLDNGVGTHAEEVNGKWTVHTKTYENWCMACGGEFGHLLPGKVEKKVGTPHANMKTSLKLDRRIQLLDENGNIVASWKNAYQMWKQHMDWMTTGQQDRLTAQLYAAAKLGQKITVEINGRSFQLVNVEGV